MVALEIFDVLIQVAHVYTVNIYWLSGTFKASYWCPEVKLGSLNISFLISSFHHFIIN